MKKLLSSIPFLTFALFGWPIDITKDEPFQIVCTFTNEFGSSEETWFIDPKRNEAFFEYEDEEEKLEYYIIEVNPKKIVLADDWVKIMNEDGSWEDYRRRYSAFINRETGKMELKLFHWPLEKGYPPEGELGIEMPLEGKHVCKNPTRK